jgi:hypothetical protein
LANKLLATILKKWALTVWARNYRAAQLGRSRPHCQQRRQVTCLCRGENPDGRAEPLKTIVVKWAVDPRKQRKIINSALHFVDLNRGKIGAERRILQFDVVLS